MAVSLIGEPPKGVVLHDMLFFPFNTNKYQASKGRVAIMSLESFLVASALRWQP